MLQFLVSMPFLVGFVAIFALGTERLFVALRPSFTGGKRRTTGDATREEQNAVLIGAAVVAIAVVIMRRNKTFADESPMFIWAATLCASLGLVSVACAIAG